MCCLLPIFVCFFNCCNCCRMLIGRTSINETKMEHLSLLWRLRSDAFLANSFSAPFQVLEWWIIQALTTIRSLYIDIFIVCTILWRQFSIKQFFLSLPISPIKNQFSLINLWWLSNVWWQLKSIFINKTLPVKWWQKKKFII